MKKIDKAMLRLLCIIGFTLIFWVLGFFSEGENAVLYNSIFSMIIIAIGVSSFYFERRSDRLRKAYKTQNRTQFSERYYRFREKNDYEYPVKKSMIADLKKRYINSFNIGMIASGISLSSFYFLACFIWKDLFNFKLCGITISIAFFCIGGGVVLCLAIPVRKFEKKYSEWLDEIEESYLSGTMVINNQVGINIGKEYIVIYSPKEVFVININNVLDVKISCTHEKDINDGIYFGSNFCFFIHIITKYAPHPGNIELGEFKCEMVRDELKRRGIINPCIDSDTNFDESEKTTVSTLY